MLGVIICLIGLLVGACIGYVLACVTLAASRIDREMEEHENDRK